MPVPNILTIAILLCVSQQPELDGRKVNDFRNDHLSDREISTLVATSQCSQVVQVHPFTANGAVNNPILLPLKMSSCQSMITFQVVDEFLVVNIFPFSHFEHRPFVMKVTCDAEGKFLPENITSLEKTRGQPPPSFFATTNPAYARKSGSGTDLQT